MEAASSCEKLITAYETIKCHKLEENNPNFQHYENLKLKEMLNDYVGIPFSIYNIKLQVNKNSFLSYYLYSFINTIKN